jgi:GT2 family glycosyltransferase
VSPEPVAPRHAGEAFAPLLSVCIVNWNTAGPLRRCLDAIEGQRRDLPLEVVVVDNDSEDGSADLVAGEFPWVTLIRSGSNLGFARGCNLGLRAGRGAYILLLNPDAVPCPGALGALVRCLGGHPEAGAAGGKLLNERGQFQWYYYRRDHGFLLWLAETLNAKAWNIMPNVFDRIVYASFDPSRECVVQMLPGGCIAVRRETVAAAGPLDEDFFLLHEDDEWCRRIRRHGYTLVFCPEARFVHRGGTSFEGWNSGRRAGQSLASRLLFLDKSYPAWLMLPARVVLVANFAAHLALVTLARASGLSRGRSGLTIGDRLRWIWLIAGGPRAVRRRRVE